MSCTAEVTYKIKKGDLTPIEATLTRNGSPIDMTGASTTEFRFRLKSGGTPTTGTATVVSATEGKIKYIWQSGQTDTLGVYLGEFYVLIGIEAQTYPSDGFIEYEVIESLAS